MQNWVYTIKISYFCLQFCPQFGLITVILAIWIMNCNTLGAYIWINMVKIYDRKKLTYLDFQVGYHGFESQSWHTLTFKRDIMGSNPKADIPWLSSGISWVRIPKLTYLDFQAGYHGFESRLGQDNFQTISMPILYSTCPAASIKWTGRCLVTDSSTKCAWVILESKAQYKYITVTAASMCLSMCPLVQSKCDRKIRAVSYRHESKYLGYTK